jgi:hypothetical protein
MAGFVHEHWLKTPRTQAATQQWFEALKDQNWRFVGLDPRLSGPSWSLEAQLQWRALVHESGAPSDPIYFTSLLLPLINQCVQGLEVVHHLDDWAALDWQVMPGQEMSQGNASEPIGSGQGQLHLPLPGASDEPLAIIWQASNTSARQRVDLTFDQPVDVVLKTLIETPTVYQSLLEATDLLTGLTHSVTQQFLDEDLDRALAEEAIALSALTQTLSRHASRPARIFLPRVMDRFLALDRLSRRVSGPYALALAPKPGNEAPPPTLEITPSGRQAIDWLMPWWLPELEAQDS